VTAVERDDNPTKVDIIRLLEEVDHGHGARDTVVIPVPTRSTAELPAVRSTVVEIVRQAVRPADPHELQLVCSELVTNAVVHGLPPVRMLLHEGADEIVVAVFDGGVAPIAVGDSPTGGLRIVDEITGGRWGSRRTRAGTWVWAVLPRGAAEPPDRDG
jgi:anti-sigma regulatory factor (Ser/Thr protein kinase)